MAIIVNSGGSAIGAAPVGSFTMSLVTGWDEISPEQGGRLPVAGDVVFLEVIKPATGVMAPGWNVAPAEDGHQVFWKMIGPREPDPVFYAAGAEEWEIKGYAVSGASVAPFGDTGSAV